MTKNDLNKLSELCIRMIHSNEKQIEDINNKSDLDESISDVILGSYFNGRISAYRHIMNECFILKDLIKQAEEK